ncbi:MAG TPA: tRNA lysidine(34) synthetase TilS [Stellaceae bacterium]
MTSAPLTVAELAAALDAIGGFEARPLVAVAVSGGPDSLALVLLAEKWARRRGGRAWALTVDHGLRPESAAEARMLAGWLAARAIPHEILMWAGDKPASGIQEAARDARYRLMAEWCRTHGCLHLLAAHQREDQIETHLIRRRAGSGIDGLAGMSAVRELEGCRLVRPLLSVPRARLLALLAQERQPFLSDPSNRNPAFERARLRLADEASGGATREAIAAELRACGGRRIERERMLDALLCRSVALHPAGFGALDPGVIALASPETAERLFGRVAAAIGRAPYPARRARLARLRAGLVAEPLRARTLGGCRFVPWRGRLLVLRELAAASAPVRVEPGACLMWDRRFAADLAQAAPSGFVLGYLGQSAAVGPERPVGDHAGDLPRLLHPVLPALWDEKGLAAVPHLGYRRPGVEGLPRLSFRPAKALSSAGFTVV